MKRTTISKIFIWANVVATLMNLGLFLTHRSPLSAFMILVGIAGIAVSRYALSEARFIEGTEKAIKDIEDSLH